MTVSKYQPTAGHNLKSDETGDVHTPYVISDGAVAAGAADSGNPVKVGGKYNTTPPTLSDGQRGDLQLSSRGMVAVQLYHTAGSALTELLGGPSDAGTNSFTALLQNSRPAVYNGATWDRVRGNIEATALASAARSSSTPTSDQTNYNGRGIQLTLDITATPNNTETLQVVIEEKDPVSGKYVQIAAFAALTASVLGATPSTATYVYTLCAGASETIAAANHEVQALPAPRTWRGRVVHSAGGSWTYSVGAVTLR